ncbi:MULTISPECIES: glycoside hydrolase family 127 protein [Bacteroides]|uniref:beta-L-arabinofuranosidase n=1 Tax=Bacteroides TaxID=816 RepID=UPI000E449215|nr:MULTISPECIES: glycoside hydrolase family 127 protein [Bacteroides]MBS7575719.1 glycoside hydrolase family 127 protein [Bacteroides propionicigenes]RGM25215.1 glycosyl hydrolase [Bacteroides sp. OM08-17BH]HBO05541.1 glycosyl hydrolase [Bacteroides sp.]
MKSSLTCLLLFFFLLTGKAQTRQEVSYFPLQDVKLLESPFLQAQRTDLHYIMAMNPDKLLAPFLREAGLTPKAPSYTNWENTGLDGHIGGHYISALSMMYAATGDTTVYNRLNYMLDELYRAQQAVGTGFIGGTPGSLQLWKEIKEGNIHAGSFNLNGKWVPLYNIHKTYAGLRDAYLYAGSDLARQMLIALTDWMADITSGLTDEQMQDMLRSEHGGLNETFADVADITGDKKYLELARKFSHKTLLEPLTKDEDCLTGMHANTQIPKVIGYKRIADLTQDHDWDHAARFFWNTVVKHRSVCIGGNSVREHFHPADNFTSMLNDVQGPETCNTYNMLRLTKMLFQSSPDSRFADYYERALYNHILASQQPAKGGFVYFTPMRSGHYRVYSQPETSMWCCVGSGLENHTKYGEFIYAHTEDTLYINLFIPSRLTWKEKNLVLAQESRFPDEEQIRFRVEKSTKKAFSFKFRYPAWAKGASVSVNGKVQDITAQPGEYLTIHRKWKAGDEITLNLPMQVTLEQIPDQEQFYAFMYGPVVLANPTGTENMDGLYADDSRGGHIAHGKQVSLEKIPMLIGSSESLSQAVRKTDDKQLSFNYTGSVYPAQKEALKLIPFFRLHDSRYAIYFHRVTQTEAESIRKEMELKERKAMELANQTVDIIFPGEQQPESDHGIQYEQAEAGTNKDRHFRRAKSWFSYNLKVKEEAGRLMIVTRKEDKMKVTILLNNEKLTVNPTISEPDKEGFITVCYPLSRKLSAGNYPIRFSPDETEWTPAIYEIRLLK